MDADFELGVMMLKDFDAVDFDLPGWDFEILVLSC